MDVTWRRVKDCCGTPGETEVYPSDGGIVTCCHGIPWEPVGPLPASLADEFARARDLHIQHLLECGWKEADFPPSRHEPSVDGLRRLDEEILKVSTEGGEIEARFRGDPR